MDSVTKSALTRIGDTSKEAAAYRLAAARRSLGVAQNVFAEAVGRSVTSYNNMEKARAYVSIDVMEHLYREHRIDFNFIIAGLYAQLPGDVQDRLFAELSVEA